MKKLTVITIAVLGAATVFAGPRHHHRRDNGVRTATDIVNLVGASLNTLNAIVNPRPTVVVTPAPAVVTPAPVVVTPAPVVVVPPARPTVIHHYHRPAPPPRRYAPPRRHAPPHHRHHGRHR